MLKRLSIRQKQIVVIMATSSVALLLACAAFVIFEIRSFRESMINHLSSLAPLVGNNCTAALTFNDTNAVKEVLGSLAKERHIVAACVYEKHGRVFESYFRDQKPFVFPPPPAQDGHRFIDKHLEMFRAIEMKDVGRIGTVYLRSDTEELSIRLEQYTAIVAVVLSASVVVALALSFSLQRLISEPILRLARMTKIVSAEKNYGLRAPKQSEDEVGQLIDGVNEMLQQIQTRDAALQTARDNLEKRVEERTRELQQEIGDRRRAEVKLTQQLTRINLLNSITRAITDRQDLESVVLVVLRELEDHLPIDLGRVYLFDAQSETISMAATNYGGKLSTGDIDLFSTATPIGETGLAPCRSGEMVLLNETAQAQNAVGLRLHAAGLRSALAVPLMVEEELFGILLAARKEAKGFSAEESQFLKMLSEQVALAANQARLHAQLQKAYDDLRQTQMAVMQQERLRALGQMASGIAHDINNALCPIVVYSDLLLQDTAHLNEGTVRNLQNIKTAGEDIAHIVSRMREFYRRRDKTDALLAVDLNKTAEQVIDLTRPRWRDIPQARGVVIELETDFAKNLPEIVGNDSELREALTNLVLNAVDAMPEGGKLIVRTRSAKSNAHGRPSSHAILEVSDSGIGMDEETRRRCLEPFFSTKGKRGTGLGLAMVYGVVERHEGKIEIDSAIGQGTTMRLIFPVRETRNLAAPQEPAKPASPLPAMRILCIDDEPLLREMMKQILESGGHTVEVADGGQSGLELFRSAAARGEPFKVVITDLGMPYLDGRQVAGTLKRESPDTPVIMLTGWGTMMKEDGDLPAQVDGVLGKPPKISELYEMLRTVTSPKKPKVNDPVFSKARRKEQRQKRAKAA